jgi:asparagine N-glycosylation enzyme membrane subunit Stt3
MTDTDQDSSRQNSDQEEKKPHADHDDDISIDFSKIKNIFGKKKPSHQDHLTHHGNTHGTHEHVDHHGNNRKNADINADKNSDSEDDAVAIDFSGIKNFFSANGVSMQKWIMILLLLIPIIFTIVIRLSPAQLAATDDWARSSVNNYYKNSIAQQVDQQYPNLPAAQKDTLLNQQFTEFEKTNKAQIDQQVAQTSEYFKTGFRYEENNKTWTFLGDLDSYFWLRQARNLRDHGSVCDEFRNGECFDNHMVAPIGTALQPSMHPYGIFALYSILRVFDKSITLMRASFLLPTILSVIAAIAAFFIGKRLMNDVAGFFAAMFVALSPLFISRTVGSDTDVWNVMFALLIVWMFIEAIEAKTLTRRITFTLITGLFAGLFSFAWSGWWYIFDFIIVACICYVLFELVRNYLTHKHVGKIISNDIKHTLLILAIFIVSAGIFVSIFSTFNNFQGAFRDPIYLSTGLKEAAKSDLWPNVYTTVAELNEAGVGTIVSQVSFGVLVLFSLALLGIIFSLIGRKPTVKEYLLLAFAIIVDLYLISSSALNLQPMTYIIILMVPVAVALLLLLRKKTSQTGHEHTEHTIDIKPAILFMVWFVGMIYASGKGIRFILLLTPVFGIAIGVAIGYLYQYFARVFKENFSMAENLSKVIVFVILCIMLIAPVRAGLATGRTFVPSMTKGWWDSLSKIGAESKPDAIINSWWDFGHWFKYVADRRVTADGASQNTPAAHWLGLALQTEDENRSVGTLRMLDCGSNNAFDEINKKLQDTEKSENIVSDIIVLSKENARKELSAKGFTDEETTTILNYTHCDPPEDYFITSEDMVGKAGVWAHFGLWNFDRAYIVTNLRNKPVDEAVSIMKERWNYSDDEASKIYYDAQGLLTDRAVNDWISPWPSYGTSRTVDCVNKSDIVLCNLGIGIGSNGQANVVIDRALINLSDPSKSQTVLGFYDSSNRKLQEAPGSFSEIDIVDKTTKKYRAFNATLGTALLLSIDRTENQTRYRAVVADPLLIDSTFTKLFFLEGKNMNHFEKFSDITDITGTRIIVWKVKW